MKFKELFGQLPNEKVNTVVNGTRNRVGTIPTYDELVNQKMASIIRGLIQKQYLIVKPSVGQGYYGDIPWICIRSKNPRISPNTQKGIYVVLLFDNIGDTFYLCLSQGYTFFETKYPVEHRREVIRKTVEYFQNELRETLIKNYGFSVERINLGENITSLGRGYEEVTIIAKKFQLTTFDESDFFNSLIALVQEYEEIITHIGSKSYEDIIELINPDDAFTTLEKAFEDIENTLVDEVVEANDVNVSPIKVEKGSAIPSRFNKISQPKIYKKVDYIKQAKEQHLIGLRGEQLALDIERNRLIELGLDPDEHIKWRSIQSDSYGYDFESVDIREGELIKIYVEVKTTKEKKDTHFYVSINELNVSKEKGETYRIFRIYDINSVNPKYYYADGIIEENFHLDPVTFSARYKYSVN